MRTIAVVVLLLVTGCVTVSQGEVKVNQQHRLPYIVANSTFLEKQKNIFGLFKYIFQTNYYKDQYEIAQKSNIEDLLKGYSPQVYAKDFLQSYKQGLFLKRGEIFTIYNTDHRKQAVTLFNLFYHANEWETFYKTAVWAREFINEGMFTYAMHVTVMHRPDLEGIILPPIYEIYPYFFVNNEVINKAYQYKMKFKKGDQTKYYIQANYSDRYPGYHGMNYYHEDVGLNAFYYNFNLDYPFWLGGNQFGLDKDRRGELYYYVHQQLLARYNLERLSHDYGPIDALNWNKPVKIGFKPNIRYPNGFNFPSSKENMILARKIEDYERRIRDVIDFGFIVSENGKLVKLYDKDGLDLLGKLIEASPDSLNTRYHGLFQIIAHQVLGYSSKHHNLPPSVLEHFETTLRDPIFYQFFQRIIHYFKQYQNHVPPYSKIELKYPGVKIEKVEIEKLQTYFERFDFEITNALYVSKEEFTDDHNGLQVWANQDRLNHKPFTYKITVDSDKEAEVVVRVFLGPKDGSLKENRLNFVEMDKFNGKVQKGRTILERNSREMTHVIKDHSSYRVLEERIMAGIDGKEEFRLDMSEAHSGFPRRFVLPIGKPGGQGYRLYVHLSPYRKVEKTFDYRISSGVGSGTRYIDDLPLGYPLDRQIVHEEDFLVPNSYIQDVVVFHHQQQ